jgi:hypothetical protein
MLNEEIDYTDSATGYGNDDSVVTDTNWPDPDEDIVDLDGIVDDAEKSVNLGLLILEGEDYIGEDEEEDGRDDGEAEVENRRGDESVSLSIPDTLFLPSEVRSMAASGVTNDQVKKSNSVKDCNSFPREFRSMAASGVSNEQEKNNRVKDSNCPGNIRTEPGSGQPSFASGLQPQPSFASGLQPGRFGPFNMAQVIIIMVISLTLLSFESWRTQVWKNEALRLEGELQKQNLLLPFTLTLLKEREALLEKQGQLEEVIERAMRRDSSSSTSEDVFGPDRSDDDKILSIKTCYLEASLSLGRCSKEWQSWWYNTPGDSSVSDADDESDDDEFTTDLSKLAKSFTKSLAATTTQSYMFVENSVKELSYDGIKDALYMDDWIPNIVQTAPDDTASNDTGGNQPRDVNTHGNTNRFQRVLSKLINGCEGSADEVTSKLSFWNW